MKPGFFIKRMWSAWTAVAVVGLLALSVRWLENLRPPPLDRRAVQEVWVTSGSDSGVGTLREAILAADRSSGRVRIILKAARIRITTSLPPVVNPLGVVFDSSGGPVTIEAASAVGPVLDIDAPGSVISRVGITGAEREAILIRGAGTRISHVSIQGCGTGVYLAEGSDDLVIDGSEFDTNEVGIHVSTAARHVAVTNNRFRGQRTAAVWAVAVSAVRDPGHPGLIVRDNRFENDNQPLVVMNQSAQIERNDVVGAKTTGLLVNGASTIVRANRVRSGIGFGVTLEELDRGVITDNEIDHNCAGAILVRNARRTEVSSNRLYANGYGIVMVMGAPTGPNTVADNLVVRQFEDGLYIIGGSPLVRRNRVLDNRHVGLRVASLRVDGDRVIASTPLLSANLLAGNEQDTVQDEFRPYAASLQPRPSADCSWRLDATAGQAGR